MSSRSDQELVKASLEGDRTAFGELVDRYEKKIYNLALRVTGNIDDAMDVTQAAFLKAYDNRDRFDPERRFFSWIYRIGLNEALDLVGGRRKSTDLSFDIPLNSPTPEREAQSREAGRAIQQALQGLKPDYRVLIVLRHFDGLSYQEMSEVTGIAVKTVKSRLFSARRELRAKLVDKQFL
jgi:RNA polymerase sigma-70 factor (ECF subfamily)